MRSFPFDSRYLFGITFSLWHASIVNFSSSCAVFKNSIADVLLFLAKTLIFFSLLSGGTSPPDDYDSDETIWKQGATPSEPLAPLSMAAPAVVTPQKLVALPEFGDESHQVAEPPDFP